MLIIGWQDQLERKYMPPRWMWHLDEELVDHFDWVKADRRENAGLEPEDEPDEYFVPGGHRPSDPSHGGMERNEHATGRGRFS